MTLEQMYAAIGGDYKAVMERLPSADFVRRFALKFLQDDSFPNLKKALEAQDAPTAFRAAHTLKGVCSRGEGVSAGRGGVERIGVTSPCLSLWERWHGKAVTERASPFSKNICTAISIGFCQS